VRQKFTDVSEKCTASIFRLKGKPSKHSILCAVIGGYMLDLLFEVKMADVRSSAKSVNFYHTIWHHIPDSTFIVFFVGWDLSPLRSLFQVPYVQVPWVSLFQVP
jgi:hypothetical protein